MKRARGVLGWVGLSALAGLIWSVVLSVQIWSFGAVDGAAKSDCIIVLGAAVYGDKPSPVFEERIRHGIHLFKDGYAPLIVFTGGKGVRATLAESEAAAKFAISNGVPQDSILTEDRSRTTQQNLAEANALMDGRGLKSAILVSDPLHLFRAAQMAEDLKIEAHLSATPTSRYQSLRSRMGFLIRELYFCHHYWITGH